jgi:hypothetical protein
VFHKDENKPARKHLGMGVSLAHFQGLPQNDYPLRDKSSFVYHAPQDRLLHKETFLSGQWVATLQSWSGVCVLC